VTHLSPRQREIVVLVGRDGKAWKTVAHEMGLHVSTVRNHVQAICAKYRVDRSPREAMVEVYWREVLGHSTQGGNGHA
jgi:DNA-binding NarL/FixJ family response regulator